MSSMKFNITSLDRSISKVLPVSNSAGTPLATGGQDEAIASFQKLIAVLKDLNTGFTEASKGLEQLRKALGIKIEEDPKPKSKNELFDEELKKDFKPASIDQGFNKASTAFKGLSEVFASDEATANVMKWSEGLATAGEKFAKGNIVEGVMQVGKTVASVLAANKKANKEIEKFNQELAQAAISYSIKAIAATKNIKSSNDSIFDSDTANKLAKGMTGYNDAQKMLQGMNNTLGGQQVEVERKKRRFLGVVTGTKAVWDSFSNGYKKILGTDKELVSATDGLDMAMANSLLASGKLSEEAKNTLTNMIEVQKAADDAMKQVNETLSQTAGTLGSDLQSALVSAFKDGGDAANEFGASVSKIMEQIITDQMFNIVFGDNLKELEDQMKGSYSKGGDGDITDDIARFYQTYNTDVEQFNKGLEEAKKQIKESSGIDVLQTKAPEPTVQSSTVGGFETMSQDQAGELNGRFTALQMSAANMEEGMVGLTDIHTQNKDTLVQQSNTLLQLCSTNVQSMYYLEDIKKNTNQLYQISDKLNAIEQNTSRL